MHHRPPFLAELSPSRQRLLQSAKQESNFYKKNMIAKTSTEQKSPEIDFLREHITFYL